VLQLPLFSPTVTIINALRAILIRSLAVLALAAACLWPLPAHAQLNVVPKQREGLEIVEKMGQKIPLDIDFLDTSGEKVTLAKYFNDGGKPVVLAMVYFRCPLICPLMLSNLQVKLSEVSLKLGEQYNLVIVSFDPTEGPAEAGKQREGFLAGFPQALPRNVRDKFGILTGSAASSQRLADALGFPYKFLPESGEYSHSTVIFTLSPEGMICRNIYGVNYSPHTLRLAILEASEGRIGTVLDRAIMWCFTYHAESGGYALASMRVMKVGAVASAVAVGIVLLLMWGVERRRRRANRVVALAQMSGPIAALPAR